MLVARELVLNGGVITSEDDGGTWEERVSRVDVDARSGYTNSCIEDCTIGNCLSSDGGIAE